MLGSVLGMLEQGATHVGVATDHVVESFRNDLWIGYKTSAGMDPELLTQFPMLEDAPARAGRDRVAHGRGRGRRRASRRPHASPRDDGRVERAFICTPDKDLGQCVEDPVVAQLDRRRGGGCSTKPAVWERFGVGPRSIPDYLALVGDTADGFPGLPGWGAKSAAAVLARYGHLDAIPDSAREWDVDVRGAAKLAATLAGGRDAAALFLDLATLRTDADVGQVDDWEWHGPEPALVEWATRLDAQNLVARAARLAEKRSA